MSSAAKPSRRFKSYPGSIYVPATCNRLYINFKGVRKATNLPDTKENRRIAEELLWEMYRAWHGLAPLRKPKTADDEALDAPIKRLFAARDEWKAHLEVTDRADKTRKAYNDSVKRILAKDSNVTADAIEIQVKAWITRNRSHYSATSINIHLRNFQVFVAWLRKRKYLKEDLDLTEFRRKGEGKAVHVYDDDTCKKLIEHVEKKAESMKGDKLKKRQYAAQYEFALLLRFLLATGARINEALRLKRSDIVGDNIVLPNKIERKTEYFPLSNAVREILALLPEDRDKVFRWAYSSTSNLLDMLHEALDDLEIEAKGGFHVFRKTFQDKLKRAGVDMADRQKLLRHRDIKTTIDSYTYSDTERLRTVLDSIQKGQ
ncbi:MAG TPA: tyrosine-type recombinase/integrase [Candidatus Didemnitutus sp.]|nr:tyrosine-type recombinase/integrase [Candidatus Didemnitutus sp.]